jgi:2-amino-4-hydroxy-6-hydroxymethyldihydropteridine diphosphokinase
MRVPVLVALGANRGSRRRHLAEAIRRLEDEGLVPVRLSGIWETEPVGAAAGPEWFCNAAAVAETGLDARATLVACLRVEREMGRVRGPGSEGGSRTIDIDLLAWANEIVDSPELTLPHPRLHVRRFVLAPLAEIAPGWRHPITGRTVAEMLGELPAGETVRRVGDFPIR